jgi:hypothetical protein
MGPGDAQGDGRVTAVLVWIAAVGLSTAALTQDHTMRIGYVALTVGAMLIWTLIMLVAS